MDEAESLWWCCNPVLFCTMAKTSQHSTVLEDVFSAYLTPGFYSEKAAGNTCSCLIFFFSKKDFSKTVFWVFFFFLPVDAFGSAHSDSLKLSLFFWPAVATLLQPSHRNIWQMYEIILCLPHHCEIGASPKLPYPLPGFPAAPQQYYKIFISILIVFFHSLSFEVNAVMSDYSESCTKPMLLFTEVTGMLVRLCLEAHRAHSELLILFMSLGTLHNLPATD